MGKVSKRSSTKGHVGDAPPAVNVAPSVRDEAQDAIETSCWRSELPGTCSVLLVQHHWQQWWQFIASNGNRCIRLRCCHARCWTDEVQEGSGEDDRYTLVADEEIWTYFIDARKLSDFMQFTKAIPTFEVADGEGGVEEQRHVD